MKKKAKPRSSRVYSEVQLTGIRHSNTIHRLATIERLLQHYIRIEWASYDPCGRNRLLELDDHDALFLTRTGKAYGQSAYYHHSIRLFALAQRKFKKKDAMEFTSHDLRHLHGRRTVTKIRKDAHRDATIESAQLERFRHVVEWRSPETIKTYITTMNKRQAMKAVLDDEGAQDQDAADA